MKFQIVGMEQIDKTVILKIIGISPLENVSHLDQLKEQMKSQMSDMQDDDKKMMEKFMTPLLMTISQAMEMDNPMQFRSNLHTTLIVDEEKFQNLDLKLGDFITFEIKKVDRTKLSEKPTYLSSPTNN